MATNKRKNYASTEGRSAEDRALDRFAEMMIEKIKSIDADWKKPWFTEGTLQWPRNLSGREYNGMNALMLMLHCEKEGYQIPVFMTFERVTSLNYSSGKERKPLMDKEGNPLAQVAVLKGAKSFPVFLTTFTVIHEETKRKISYDDYKKLSPGEQQEYKVYPKLQVYNVFNADQTNMKETRPELYEKLKAANVALPPELAATGYCFPAMDEMIRNNEWLCPIHLKHQDRAYYSLKNDEIVLPEKEQFYEGESFYGTAFHEMVHSTGAESRLKRFEPGSYFGSPGYAREELVAELGSALVMQKHGLTKTVKEESCAYLKNWLTALKESPEYIKSILTDVKRSTAMVGEKIEEVNLRLTAAPAEKEQVSLLPISRIPSADVMSEIHLADKEACDAVHKILVDYMRGEPNPHIEVGKCGNHVVRIEGNCINDAMEMLAVGLDAETYDKITKASCYLNGYPVERYRDVFVNRFTDEFEKKRNDPQWLEKQGLEGKVTWEMCLPGVDDYYVVKAFAQGKCMVGALDHKCNAILPFVEVADEKRLEDTLCYYAEMRRRLLSVNEKVDPLGRISFNGSPVEDSLSKSVSREILIDGEAKAVFVSRPDDKYDLNFTLDLGNSPMVKRLADFYLFQHDREKGTFQIAVNNLNDLYYWKDQVYAPRVIDEQTNMNVYDYVGMQLPKCYEAIDDEVVNERQEEVEHEERVHTGMRR